MSGLAPWRSPGVYNARSSDSLRTTGMLGVFDHVIDFPESWEFVIMYGPNGVGKTKLLEAADALAKLSTAKLKRIPFGTLELQFSDGTTLIASRDAEKTETGVGPKNGALRLSLVRGDAVLADATVESGESSDFVDWLITTTTWQPFEEDLWEDTIDGEIVPFVELRQRYGRRFTTGQRSGEPLFGGRIPEPIREFTRSIGTHLIETQRLVTVLKSRSVAPDRRREPMTRTTVAAYSEDLKERLAKVLAQNSRTTQQLDRTFPRRILERPAPSDVDDEMIRVKYQQQSELREQLAGIAVIGGEVDLPLPQRPLVEWERHVLWTSLEDTDAKLSSFDEILSKIKLLEDIVNRRFLGKRIMVNAEQGLTIRADQDGRPLSPESLSSGEQHELILIYDFLFNAQPGTTVLLDEPEISLHVAWQQQFLNDIVRISKLSSLRFIVATHSPQIIHKWWSRTVQLGPDAEE